VECRAIDILPAAVGRLHMKKTWLAVRSAILGSSAGCIFSLLRRRWCSWGFFWMPANTIGSSAVCADASLFCRARGWKSSVPPDFDASRTCFFMSNHVNPFRSVHALLRDSTGLCADGSWNRTSRSGVRLADEALRQRSRSGYPAAVGFEAHVAAHAGRRRWRDQPDYFFRKPSDAQRARGSVPGRRLPGVAQQLGIRSCR